MPLSVPLSELEARITELAGHLNAADHRWLMLVAEFDRREGWADGATRSCAHWLGWKCGIELGAAREKVRVARALETLPGIGEAMGRGELSYSKVRALTRVATPATEQTLLMIALHGTAHHVEAVVRGYRRAQESVELSKAARQHAGRTLQWHHDDDGSLVLRLRLPAESGALVLSALQQAMDEGSLPDMPVDGDALSDPSDPSDPSVRPDPAQDVPAGTPSASAPLSNPSPDAADVPAGTSEAQRTGSSSPSCSDPIDTPSQRRADAFVRIAESWLAHGDRALAGGTRQQIVVHVDARTLAADAPGRSELDDGPVLAAETVRRLGCDASLVAIVEDARGNVLDVGRRTRSIPSAIGRALRARDRGCRYPGCTHTRFVDGHHIEHWARGGATRLSNLVLLCRRHHRQVHEGGVRVQALDDGALRFTDALGRRIDAAPPSTGTADAIIVRNRDAGLRIEPHTAVGRWRGERLDLGLAVAGLCVESRTGRGPMDRMATERPPTHRMQASARSFGPA